MHSVSLQISRWLNLKPIRTFLFFWLLSLINLPIHSSTQAKACLCPRRRTSRITWGELENKRVKSQQNMWRRQFKVRGCESYWLKTGRWKSENKLMFLFLHRNKWLIWVTLSVTLWVSALTVSMYVCVKNEPPARSKQGQSDPRTNAAKSWEKYFWEIDRDIRFKCCRQD